MTGDARVNHSGGWYNTNGDREIYFASRQALQWRRQKHLVDIMAASHRRRCRGATTG
jgi:hypothetical protein